MTKTIYLSIVLLALASTAAAQPAQPAVEPPVKLKAGDTPVPGECLTREELDLNAALQALKRPTRGVEQEGDDAPRFNPNYFVGTWNIEGVLPESPLGSAGEITGVETVRHLDGCTYESTMKAKSPDGAFTVKTLMVYDRRAGYMVRQEQDSRGFQLLKTGVVGGDAGGYFTHHWEAPQVTYKGKPLRLKGNTFLASPENFRLRMQISVDGKTYANFGTIWWRREGTPTPK
jgi:hypothetical protein